MCHVDTFDTVCHLLIYKDLLGFLAKITIPHHVNGFQSWF